MVVIPNKSAARHVMEAVFSLSARERFQSGLPRYRGRPNHLSLRPSIYPSHLVDRHPSLLGQRAMSRTDCPIDFEMSIRSRNSSLRSESGSAFSKCPPELARSAKNMKDDPILPNLIRLPAMPRCQQVPSCHRLSDHLGKRKTAERATRSGVSKIPLLRCSSAFRSRPRTDTTD